MIRIKIFIGRILKKIDTNRQNKCDKLTHENIDNEYAQEVIDWERGWKLPADIYITILKTSANYCITKREKYKNTSYETDMSIYYEMSYKYYKIIKNRIIMFINLIFNFRDYKDY